MEPEQKPVLDPTEKEAWFLKGTDPDRRKAWEDLFREEKDPKPKTKEEV